MNIITTRNIQLGTKLATGGDVQKVHKIHVLDWEVAYLLNVEQVLAMEKAR